MVINPVAVVNMPTVVQGAGRDPSGPEGMAKPQQGAPLATANTAKGTVELPMTARVPAPEAFARISKATSQSVLQAKAEAARMKAEADRAHTKAMAASYEFQAESRSRAIDDAVIIPDSEYV